MMVFCTGIPRSGSTWSYNVCLRLITAAFPHSRIKGAYSEQIGVFLDAERANADHFVIKCHSVDDAGRKSIESHRAKLVCTYRDPKEAIASGIEVFGHSFDVMLDSVWRGYEFMDYQRRYGDVVFVKYDDMISDTRACIRKIARHLCIEIDDIITEEIDHKCSRAAMEAIAKAVERFELNDIYMDETYAFHLGTLIHRKHLRPVGSGYEGVLSDDQVMLIEEKFLASDQSWQSRWGPFR
jgi:hypothetical protein